MNTHEAQSESLRILTLEMWKAYVFGMWERNQRDRVTDIPAYLGGYKEGAD